MDNLKVIDELSRIIQEQAALINKLQHEMNLVGLHQFDYTIDDLRYRYNAIFGPGEWPAPGED